MRMYVTRRRVIIRCCCVAILVLGLWRARKLIWDDFYFDRFIAEIFLRLRQFKTYSQISSDGYLGSNGSCVIPVVYPFRDEVVKHYKDVSVKCPGKRKFTYKNGRLYASLQDVNDGSYTVQYIRRINDNKFGMSDPLTLSKDNIDDDSKMLTFAPEEDFVVIKGPKGHIEMHANARHNANLEQQRSSVRLKDAMNLKIVMIMIESQSAANFDRLGKKTLSLLKNLEDTHFLKGHSIVGDGTTAQACAVLTGIAELALPEARKSFNQAKPVDRWPFIFNTFKKSGYITMYLEDQANYASFNYRLLGFTNPPTDHYPRPFFLSSLDETKKKYCIGSVQSHVMSLDYTASFLDAYPNSPLFAFTNIAKCCHDNFNNLRDLDGDLAAFVNRLKEKNYLNSTALFIFGDHGHRTTPFRASVQGKLEERLPFISITLPSWFKHKYPSFHEALKHNSELLTSHFDLHATLVHMLRHPLVIPRQKTGQSLFTKIDFKTRSCLSAGVPDHYCPCLEYEEVSVTGKHIWELGEHIVSKINDIVGRHPVAKNLCQKLVLQEVIRAGKRKVNWKVEQFVQTLADRDCDSCKLVFSGGKRANEALQYELVVKVAPSGGLYEASVVAEKDHVFVDENMSRVNRYGDQPKCIQQDYPHLRNYCYCNNYMQS